MLGLKTEEKAGMPSRVCKTKTRSRQLRHALKASSSKVHEFKEPELQARETDKIVVKGLEWPPGRAKAPEFSTTTKMMLLINLTWRESWNSASITIALISLKIRINH